MLFHQHFKPSLLFIIWPQVSPLGALISVVQFKESPDILAIQFIGPIEFGFGFGFNWFSMIFLGDLIK